jgi:hypothetical protein
MAYSALSVSIEVYCSDSFIPAWLKRTVDPQSSEQLSIYLSYLM